MTGTAHPHAHEHEAERCEVGRPGRGMGVEWALGAGVRGRARRCRVVVACRPGARRASAASEAGLDPRTLERWRAGAVDDERRGPRTVPKNKLSARERERVVEIATSPEVRDLSPKQIVPRLADKGAYIASESTFYRVLRDEKLLAHRGRSAAPSPRPRTVTHQRRRDDSCGASRQVRVRGGRRWRQDER